tara:strand:- start:1190 stop:1567 length:378 start_codon:yes stop_codon:yes gene_type:complete
MCDYNSESYTKGALLDYDLKVRVNCNYILRCCTQCGFPNSESILKFFDEELNNTAKEDFWEEYNSNLLAHDDVCFEARMNGEFELKADSYVLIEIFNDLFNEYADADKFICETNYAEWRVKVLGK